jgi:AcrR family transcriptional regulator
MDGAKSVQSQATKQRLEQDARALFERHGFAGVSAEELAAQSGVTRGALYHHYGGKEGLFEAVTATIMQEVHNRLASQAAGAADPLEALKRGTKAFFEICTEPGTHRILFVDAPSVLGWARWREMDAQYGLGLIKRALLGAMKARLIREQDIDILSHALVGSLTELAMVIVRSSSPQKAQSAAERTIGAMIDGLRCS